ncbi:MAG: DUF885 domain-containing protein [Chloroflexota bacterium]
MSDFSSSVEAFLDEFFRLDPVSATAAGMHAHDDRWPDVTEAGRRERLAFIDRWEDEFRAPPDTGLTADERIDRDLLLLELDAMRFNETELREETWDPLAWVYLLGGGIFPLLAREFAPLAERLDSIAARLEGIPAVLSAARAQLGSHPTRPVSQLHTETALKQLAGIAELAADAVREAERAASENPAVAAQLDRLRSAAAIATAALEGFAEYLRDTLLPLAEGEGRLGPELFRAKLRRTLKSDAPTPEEILARAEREYPAIRAEMVRIAREIWPAWIPDRAAPDAAGAGSPEAADSQIVREVLDAIAREHQPASRLLAFCREELGRIEAFCRDRDLVGLPDEPLEIRWTPVFLRAFGGAMLSSPGPLDRGQKAFFAITPIPEDWTPEQVESYLREDNDRMLRLLTIHEAIPGHYLQGAYANRCPSIVRAVFWSGVFAEGWAVYVTQLMMDLGYGADDPALLLVHWKFYLRSITNAIIDVRIHTAGMTEQEAISLMVEGGFQEEAEARAKYNRARLSSTQLSTYFIGSIEMWELELERRRRLAASSGDPRGAAAVPEPRLVGGLGETPGFRYREHLETVLAHGTPPVSLLRRLVLG